MSIAPRAPPVAARPTPAHGRAPIGAEPNEVVMAPVLRSRTSFGSGRGWIRTSGVSFVRGALCPAELLARGLSPRRWRRSDRSRHGSGGAGAGLRSAFRDKGSNLDLHVQSVVSYRLDDPGTGGRPVIWAPAVSR